MGEYQEHLYELGLSQLTIDAYTNDLARLVDSGVSLDKVSILLGHSSLSVTAIYTRPSDGDLHQAVARLEAVQRG